MARVHIRATLSALKATIYNEIAFGMLYFGGRRSFAELYEEENKRAMRGEGGDYVPYAYRNTVPTLSRRPLPAELVIPSNAHANSVSVLSAGGLLTVRDSQITINYGERIDIYPFKGPLNPRVRFHDGVIGLTEGAQRLYMYYGIDVRGLRGIDVCNKLLAMTSRRGEYSEVFALLPQPIAEEINYFYGRIVFFAGKKQCIYSNTGPNSISRAVCGELSWAETKLRMLRAFSSQSSETQYSLIVVSVSLPCFTFFLMVYLT
jgi:hypothetical protein